MNAFTEKCLIVYFSRAGQNYCSGEIKNLPVGNTQLVAEKISHLCGAELFCIEPVVPYPENYYQCAKQARLEQLMEARPALRQTVTGMDKYDVIFLGYPVWWGTIPLPVRSFLEAYDFTDKIILPFCTHEGSDMGWSMKDIQQLCPNSDVRRGLAVHGAEIERAQNQILPWLDANVRTPCR